MRLWPALTLTFPIGASADGVDVTLQDLMSAALDGLDVVAIAEQPDAGWQVVFRDCESRSAAAAALMRAHGPGGLAVTALDVPDEDWARRSQEALRAVRVGGIVVAPPWDAAPGTPAGEAFTIVIEPAMGFGSGHHATTQLCLEALQRLDLHGRRVLDIGTGSGVLALAASRLGAATVLAIDVDPDALGNARTNAALNGQPAAIEFRLADFRQEQLPASDVVMANLTGALLAASVADVVKPVAAGGALILSGITGEEREHVLAAFSGSCAVGWLAEQDGWFGALLHPKP